MECKTPENEFIHNFPNLDKSQQISYTSLLKYNSASTQTFFGKTFCFKSIMFDVSMPRLQDWDEALRLSLQYKIFFQNEILVNTFFQKDSISTHPEKLERQLAFLKENNADIVLCKMECKTPENEFIHNFPKLDKSQQISYTSLLKYNSASTQTFFGKTFCFKNIMFDASMPRLQDWDEALRLSLQYKIFFQNEILVNTFFQKDSISTHPEKGVAAMKKLFQKHSQQILSDKKTAESFLKKQAAFVCKTGKNPTEEFALLLKISPGLSVFLRYLLSLLGIYSFLFRLVLKK